MDRTARFQNGSSFSEHVLTRQCDWSSAVVYDTPQSTVIVHSGQDLYFRVLGERPFLIMSFSGVVLLFKGDQVDPSDPYLTALNNAGFRTFHIPVLQFTFVNQVGRTRRTYTKNFGFNRQIIGAGSLRKHVLQISSVYESHVRVVRYHVDMTGKISTVLISIRL